MKSANCWEIMKCGLEPEGHRASTGGICPAAQGGPFEGFNRGRARGRACWMVGGSLCPSLTCSQLQISSKLKACLQCPVLIQVSNEEANDFRLMPPHRTTVNELA